MEVGRGQNAGLHLKYIIVVSKVKRGPAMDWIDLEKHFSPARLGRYLASCAGDERRAEAAYSKNMLLAEAMIPMLSVLEIALKNGVHHRLSVVYQRADWWTTWTGNPSFAWQCREVANAEAKLKRRVESGTPDKIVAELAFGFWSSLFNAHLQELLWKELRLVFPRCPKPQRQRHTIASALNQIRELRNRVFHREQLIWITPPLIELHTRGIEVIGWLDPQLPHWIAPFDRLPATWASSQPV